MKKLNLKMGGIKEMLSREQMKKVVGGYGYDEGTSCPQRCVAICEATYPGASPQKFSGYTNQPCGPNCGFCSETPEVCYARGADWKYLGMTCG